MRPSVPLAVLSLLCATVPAAAQDPVQRFPGVPWGVTADSVIRILGEPAHRRPAEMGLEELGYLDDRDGRPLARYILVHPSMGVIMAGYRVTYATDCAAQLRAIAADVERTFPRLRWQGGGGPTGYDCTRQLARASIDGLDPATDAHVSIRMDRGDMELIADALSREGWQWLRRRQ
jgi:hypothetical protein